MLLPVLQCLVDERVHRVELDRQRSVLLRDVSSQLCLRSLTVASAYVVHVAPQVLSVDRSYTHWSPRVLLCLDCAQRRKRRAQIGSRSASEFHPLARLWSRAVDDFSAARRDAQVRDHHRLRQLLPLAEG